MSILTSDSFLITWSVSLGFVCIPLKLIATGTNILICNIGICIGIWGLASAYIVHWKQMNPNHNTRKHEIYANVAVFVSVPCFLLLNYLFTLR